MYAEVKLNIKLQRKRNRNVNKISESKSKYTSYKVTLEVNQKSKQLFVEINQNKHVAADVIETSRSKESNNLWSKIKQNRNV
jgi:hypothetical protein